MNLFSCVPLFFGVWKKLWDCRRVPNEGGSVPRRMWPVNFLNRTIGNRSQYTSEIFPINLNWTYKEYGALVRAVVLGKMSFPSNNDDTRSYGDQFFYCQILFFSDASKYLFSGCPHRWITKLRGLSSWLGWSTKTAKATSRLWRCSKSRRRARNLTKGTSTSYNKVIINIYHKSIWSAIRTACTRTESTTRSEYSWGAGCCLNLLLYCLWLYLTI